MPIVPDKTIPHCAACTKSVRTVQQLKCSKCSSLFHAMCVNVPDIRNVAEEVKAAWVCPICKSGLPKSDNTNSPARAVAPGELRLALPITSAGSRKNTPACSPAITPDPDPLEMLFAEMKLMREDMGDLKKQMTYLTDHTIAKLDECSTKCRELEERDAIRERELCSLRLTVTELREQFISRAQSSLKNELELSGINESRDENLTHLVRVTATKVGVDLEDGDIDYVMRVGPRRSESDEPYSKLPRPVVIRFVRRQKREDFLKAAKSRRTLSSTDIGVDGPDRKLYFNERLTQENRQLFRSARQRCNDAGFKFCWIRNGTIFARRKEGSSAIPIKSTADMERCLVPTLCDSPAPPIN